MAYHYFSMISPALLLIIYLCPSLSPAGIVLTSFQLSFKVASLVYTPTYTKIYQHTLDWLPGFVFLLSSSISVLATIPIRFVESTPILITKLPRPNLVLPDSRT